MKERRTKHHTYYAFIIDTRKKGRKKWKRRKEKEKEEKKYDEKKVEQQQNISEVKLKRSGRLKIQAWLSVNFLFQEIDIQYCSEFN